MEGIWTALWTPLDREGKLLKEAVLLQAERLFEQGIEGVALLGSTGQYPFCSGKARKELLDAVVGQIDGKRVVVNISSACQDEVKELANHAASTKALAVMLQPPSYYLYTQEDISCYMIEVAKKAKLPLILYNYPECVRNRLELATIEKIAKEVNVISIKQSGRDFEYHAPLVELGKKMGFSVCTGSDTRLDEALALGVQGSIGGLSNGLAKEIVGAFRAWKKQDVFSLKACMQKIKAVDELISPLLFPLNIQVLMEAQGLEVGTTKAILAPSTYARYEEVKERLKKSYFA